MNIPRMLIGLAMMAGITYLCRALTFVLFRKKIENVYVKSFLHYLPYGVLSAMVFPAIMFSTSSLISAAVGTVVALIMALLKRGLLVVALSSTLAVFLLEIFVSLPF